LRVDFIHLQPERKTRISQKNTATRRFFHPSAMRYEEIGG